MQGATQVSSICHKKVTRHSPLQMILDLGVVEIPLGDIILQEEVGMPVEEDMNSPNREWVIGTRIQVIAIDAIKQVI